MHTHAKWTVCALLKYTVCTSILSAERTAITENRRLDQKGVKGTAVWSRSNSRIDRPTLIMVTS